MAELRSNNRRFGNRSGIGFRGRPESRNNYGGGFRDRNFDRSDRPTEMHEAICSKCGKNCQVPFKPTGSKPVLCSDCFRQSGGGSSRDSGRGSRGGFGSRGPDRRSSGPPQSGISPEQFNQINAKLDKILGVLQELELDTEEEPEDDSDEEESEENSAK
ncbi:MAG: hypothetical protein NTX24_00495 [Candidatus Pacearchaeota archaeon]|nr:hypothetical protein [Candidatus Pacearchaeota archaeon]